MYFFAMIMMLSYSYQTELPKVEPMVVAVWCGDSKPPLMEYMEPFVSEMDDLLKNGCTINSHQIKIKFGVCPCDSPARSWATGTNIFHHDAYYVYI